MRRIVWFALLAQLSLALTVAPFASPSTVHAGADCVFTHQSVKLAGAAIVSLAEGVRSEMAYVNPAVCYLPPPHHDEFSLESVTVCRTNSCDGWVQTGLIKRYGWTEPQMYCEFAPRASTGNQRTVEEAPISNASHLYSAHVEWRLTLQVWDCELDAGSKFAYSTNYLGFNTGSWLAVQGETDSLYSQIGKVAPSKFRFWNMKYLASGSWIVYNLCGTCLNDISGWGQRYGHDEPAAGEFRNWTN